MDDVRTDEGDEVTKAEVVEVAARRKSEIMVVQECGAESKGDK
jgi:hypothetical protein